MILKGEAPGENRGDVKGIGVTEAAGFRIGELAGLPIEPA